MSVIRHVSESMISPRIRCFAGRFRTVPLLALAALAVLTACMPLRLGHTENVYRFWIDQSSAEFDAKVKEYQEATVPLKLVDVEVYTIKGTTLYAGVWHQNYSEHRLVRSKDWSAFETERRSLEEDGYSLVDLEVFVRYSAVEGPSIDENLWDAATNAIKDFLGGAARKAIGRGGPEFILGIFRKDVARGDVYYDLTWDQFDAKRIEQQQRRYHLIDIEVYTNSGYQVRYAGIWRRSGGEQTIWKTGSKDDFVSKNTVLVNSGMRLTDMEIFQEQGRTRYLGVWHEGNDRQDIAVKESFYAFKGMRAEYDAHNPLLVDLEIDEGADAARLLSGIWRYGKGGKSNGDSFFNFDSEFERDDDPSD